MVTDGIDDGETAGVVPQGAEARIQAAHRPVDGVANDLAVPGSEAIPQRLRNPV